MTDSDDEKARAAKAREEKRMAYNKQRMRVARANQAMRRAQAAASAMPTQALIAKLKELQQTYQIMHSQLKVSCQHESLAHATHVLPQSSPPTAFITPPRGGAKHNSSPTGGSGNGRDKTFKPEQEEEMPTPQRLAPSPNVSRVALAGSAHSSSSAIAGSPSTWAVTLFEELEQKVSPDTAKKLVEHFTIKELQEIIGVKQLNFPDDEDDLLVEWERYYAN